MSQLLGSTQKKEVNQFLENMGKYRTGELIISLSGGGGDDDNNNNKNDHAPSFKPGPTSNRSTSSPSIGNASTPKPKPSTSHRAGGGGGATTTTNKQNNPKPPPPPKGRPKDLLSTKKGVSMTTRKPPPQPAVSSQTSTANPSTSKTPPATAAASTTLAGEQPIVSYNPQPASRGVAKFVCGCFGTFHKPLTNCLL